MNRKSCRFFLSLLLWPASGTNIEGFKELFSTTSVLRVELLRQPLMAIGINQTVWKACAIFCTKQSKSHTLGELGDELGTIDLEQGRGFQGPEKT